MVRIKAFPQLEETIKGVMPFFDYNGSVVCNMASFKAHCAFVFWKASLMKDPAGIFNKDGHNAMGQFDRISSLKDLPADKILISYIKEAAKLNEEGIKLPARPKAAAKELPVPEALTAALKKNKKANTVFEQFAPSHRKEYIQWITEAKTDTTRDKRIAEALVSMAEGKGKNWKYEKKLK